MRIIDADALMALIETQRERAKTALEGDSEAMRATDGLFLAIEALILTEPTVEVSEPQRWIPVSERLPERNKMDSTGKFREAYLVTTGFITFTARFNENGYWVLWGYAQVLKNIIAWMPLPEPYGGGDDENDRC